MISKLRVFVLFLCAGVVVAGLGYPTSASSASAPIGSTVQDIRIDVPPDARVRIENHFGAITASVWKEKFVSVSATMEGNSAPLKRSPIVIENKNKLLRISVVRTPLDPAVGIALSVMVPEGVHAEVDTVAGPIVITGIPASVSLRSSTGDIRAELPSPLNLDISARSDSGVIRSTLAAPLSADGRVLQARLGTGERVLRINTDRGSITLGFAERQDGSAVVESQPPRLQGSETPSKGSGTPANSAETEEVSEGDIIRVDSQLTALNVSVIDRNTSRGVMGLTQRDFELHEDGVKQDIVQFDSSAAPFDLVLLIDVSGSTRDKVKLIRAAALRFVAAARPSAVLQLSPSRASQHSFHP